MAETLAPYGFMVSNRDIMAEVCGLVRNRGLVVNYSKEGIEESFRRPIFPKDRQETADLLLSLRRQGGWPGLHVTHAEYRSPPKNFEDSGEKQAVHFFLDLDGRRSLGPTRPVVSAMAKTLDRLGVPHWVSYSGKNGFHLHIPASAFPDRLDDSPFPTVAPKVFLGIKHLLIRRAREKCPTELASCVIHPKEYYPTTQGIQRLPFSRHEGTGEISVPMPDHSIRTFDPRSRHDYDKIQPDALSEMFRGSSGSAEVLIALAEAENRLPRPPHSTR